MAALKGLTGLYGDPQDTTDTMDEGVLEAKANAPDPEHGQYGSQSYGYSGTVPSASPFSDLQVYDAGVEGVDYGGTDYNVQGNPWDSAAGGEHSAPFPRGIVQPSWGDPDAYALVGQQLETIHGTDTGGVRLNIGHAPAGHEEQTDYTTDMYQSFDATGQAAVPGQLKYGGDGSANGRGSGNADVVQGYGVANTLGEFSHGRSIRRVQHDRMPQDYTLTHGEQDVPFFGRHPVGQMPLDGPDSPYFEQGSIEGGQIPWEGRIGDPTAYVQPPEVTVSPYPLPSDDVFAWG
jgi:hypothetical protein